MLGPFYAAILKGTNTVAQQTEKPVEEPIVFVPEWEDLGELAQYFSNRLYVTRETAEFLALRVGGRLGTYQFKWATAKSAVPGIKDIVQPPPFWTIEFYQEGAQNPYTAVPAGDLAYYYKPGVSRNPDRLAAEYLWRHGVSLTNPFLSANLPTYLKLLRRHPINPLTGEPVAVDD